MMCAGFSSWVERFGLVALAKVMAESPSLRMASLFCTVRPSREGATNLLDDTLFLEQSELLKGVTPVNEWVFAGLIILLVAYSFRHAPQASKVVSGGCSVQVSNACGIIGRPAAEQSAVGCERYGVVGFGHGLSYWVESGPTPARLAAAAHREAMTAGLARRTASSSAAIARSREIIWEAECAVRASRCAAITGCAANAAVWITEAQGSLRSTAR